MQLILGNCLEKLKELKDNSVDSVVTDPPYGISFMGKKWDYDVPSVDIWKECLRVLKPGGYLLSFAGTRTQHRMAVNIEDAGFEIRDMIAWVYGSGFPKSLNIGKAVDKLQGNEREVVGKTQSVQFQEKGYEYKGDKKGSGFNNEKYWGFGNDVTKGTSDWEGWGTALKPALEPITVARKPLGEKTVAENCLKWGVGGINIDGCRVGTDTRTYKGMSSNKPEVGTFRDDNWKPKNIEVTATGRFPANLIHDGSDEVVGLFPVCKQAKNVGEFKQLESMRFSAGGEGVKKQKQTNGEIISASASRFFYCAKASKKERNIGCEGLEEKPKVFNGQSDKPSEDMKDVEKRFTTLPVANFHPTVKPLALMEYLVKLVSREGQVVLDPFMGSGTTGMACKRLGREFIGIEIDEEYFKIAQARIDAWKADEQLKLVEH